MNLSKKIFQIILADGPEISVIEISKLLNISETEIEKQIEKLKEIASDLEMQLIYINKKISIFSSKEISTLFENKNIEDLQKPLSESSLQTLAVILYKNECTKAEIDFIRGVDSSKSLKSLILRGLIEKKELKGKKIYLPTTNTLVYLGVKENDQIPNYIEVNNKLGTLLKNES